MPRQKRVLVEGATYHVYARVTRREGIFTHPEEADAWLAAVQEVKRRDGFAVLAWCLMSNHFHLVLRTGPVPLSRSMRSLQGRFAMGFNRRHRLIGPVWQSRYKARLVESDRYLRRLVAYVHLNPVAAGLVARPEDYPRSGHREILGRATATLADPDELLRLFGEARPAARRVYRETIRVVAAGLHAQGVTDGWLDVPDDDDAPLGVSRVRGPDAAGRGPARDRRPRDAASFVHDAVGVLGVTLDALSGRQQSAAVVRLREAICLVGTERYGLRLKAVAEAMGKGAESATRWVMHASARRHTDPEFAALLERLDADLAWPAVHPSIGQECQE
ncbi:MAG: transposase [Thermoanaerobaculaceae bacterium]|jgi:REP element-mobilizing transposase RayT|nr:transposase [Thermoanaerobaculaceae bacterium]